LVNVPTAGNVVVVCTAVADHLQTISMSDDFSDGNSWNTLIGPITELNDDAALYIFWKAIGTPSGGGKTVTATASGSANVVLSVVEYAVDVGVTWASDGSASSTEQTATDPTPGAINTTGSNGVVIGYCIHTNSTALTSVAGFTSRVQLTGSAAMRNEDIEDQITTASGSYTAGWTAASQLWRALAGAIKATATAAGVTYPQLERFHRGEFRGEHG
jgi:hypothetical protein